MTYACPTWDFAADTHLLKLQRPQNKVLRTIGNFPRCTVVRELQKAFSIPYIYDYMTKLSRQQAEVLQNHENVNVRNKAKPDTESTITLNLVAFKHTTIKMTRLPL
jgi:hypothetical protein